MIGEEAMMTTCDTPKVWLGCLAAYNRGYLHGEWIDLSGGVDSFDDACRRILESSPVPGAEELWGMDSELLGSGEIGPGTARRVAERFDEGVDADEWCRRMVSEGCDVELAVSLDWDAEGVYGPYGFEMDAESGADDLLEDLFYDQIRITDRCNYISFDYDRARRDLFDVVEGPGGSWWLVETF